jgi:hypothetical protein
MKVSVRLNDFQKPKDLDLERWVDWVCAGLRYSRKDGKTRRDHGGVIGEYRQPFAYIADEDILKYELLPVVLSNTPNPT